MERQRVLRGQLGYHLIHNLYQVGIGGLDEINNAIKVGVTSILWMKKQA